MKIMKFYIIVITIITITACSAQRGETYFVTTSAPLAMILKEIVGNKAKVDYIVPPNASPHTYNPKPSDGQKIAKATAFFYVSQNNDGWAVQLNNPITIELFRLVDKSFLLNKEFFYGHNNSHKHDEDCNHSNTINDSTLDYQKYDSHFWTDPVLLQTLTLRIVDTLSKFDKSNEQYYKANAEAFIKKLKIIDRQIQVITEKIKDKPIFLHHPSFLYFIKRYGLTYGGSLEPNPGQELTPKSLSNIIESVKKSGVKAIFSEPQLPDKLVKLIAKESGVAIFQLDPIGTDFNNYNDFILYNANKLKEALE